VFEISDMADPLPPHIQVQLETLCLPDAAKGGLRRGLGLFVVVSFCRQMGWGLAVESVRPKGKRISLRVPLGVDPVCD
jgi:sensor histidine kinase regulating citrate/malate metabolism